MSQWVHIHNQNESIPGGALVFYNLRKAHFTKDAYN
jgi:hypothetical protein